MDRLAQTGLVQNPIRFTVPELLKELKLTRSKELYDKIQEWGERMTQTSIVSRGIIYRKSMKAYIDTTEHVFRKFAFIRPIGKKGRNAVIMCEVTLEDWVLENMNQRYVVREDLNAYRRLSGDLAKGIFDFLHIWFNASKGLPIERSYTLICQRLGVTEYPHRSRIKNTMGKALDELVSIGYLTSWSLLRMKSTDGFKFGLVAGKELLRVLKLSEKKSLVSGGTSQITFENNRVVEELVALGVSRDKAVGLSKLGPEEVMLDRIEYINSLIYKKERVGQQIDNPAGFIIKLLENGTQVPSNFVTSRQREAILEAQRKERELQEQQRDIEFAYHQWCANHKKLAVARKYAPAELEREARAKLPEFMKEYPYMKRLQPEQRIRDAKMIIEKEIGNELALPTLEQWTEMDEYKNVQNELF